LALLPLNGGRVSSRELLTQYYGAQPPLNARAILTNRLRGLAAKAEFANEPWRICKGPRAGPKPIDYWREAR